MSRRLLCLPHLVLAAAEKLASAALDSRDTLLKPFPRCSFSILSLPGLLLIAEPD
jgi:hypothetical protein